MALIPDSVLEEIQDKTDIVELVAGYIPLRRAGRNFRALCPFHHEKTPSFMVNPQKRIFHCFGCGAGGDVFGFVMKYERIEFPEAVKQLAEKANVTLPERYIQPDVDTSLVSSIQRANELASAYYHDLLFDEKLTAPRSYLSQRGIKDHTAREFKLGFAADNYKGLLNFCSSKGVNANILEKAGLIIKHPEWDLADRFRRKLMFPIFDVKGRVIGFGARVLDNSLPKYINSPETPLFNKSKCLYGINLSGKHIRDNDKALIVEGYVDFLSPYQHGIKNIVASLGTALTTEQIRLISRFTKNVVMVYDGDAAGEAATLRGLDLLVGENFNVKIVALDKGFDPDTFILNKGQDALAAKIKDAHDLFDYKLSLLVNRHDPAAVEGKVKIISEMLPTLARMNNAVLKSLYVKRLSERLACSENAILTELGKEKVLSYDYYYTPEAPPAKKQVSPAEKLCAAIFLDDYNLAKLALKEIAPEDFKDDDIRAIVGTICEYVNQGKSYDTAKIITHLRDGQKSQLASELALSIDEVIDKERTLRDCIKRMKHDNLKKRLDELQTKIHVAQGSKESQKLDKLMAEYNELVREYSSWRK
ncbi:MAG: DNA primase [Candidatus Omnitrophota bacterium]